MTRKDIVCYFAIVCMSVSCSSRAIQQQVNEILENKPWHGPATVAFYTFTWLHYRIPESLDELVAFLEMDKEQASEEELKYMYFGNIDELIADFKRQVRKRSSLKRRSRSIAGRKEPSALIRRQPRLKRRSGSSE